MKKLLIFALILVACGLSPVIKTHAAPRKKASPPPTDEVDMNDRITALHLTSVTVTIGATHQSVEYKVNAATKITVNGQPGMLSGLAVGMDIRVTPLPNDPTAAATIDAKTVKK